MPELPERKSPKEERTYVVEVGKFPETPAEKEGLVKRVLDIELEKPVTHNGQVLLTSSYAQRPKIVLPVSRTVYLNPANWHRPVFYAIRWLLTWVQRIIKMQPGQTVFQGG